MKINNNIKIVIIFVLFIVLLPWVVGVYFRSTVQVYPRQIINYNVNSELLSVKDRMESNTIIMVRISKDFDADESDSYRLMHKVVNNTSSTEFAEFFGLKRQAEDMGEIKKVLAWGNIYCREGLLLVGLETLYSPSMGIIGANKIGSGYPDDGFFVKGFDTYSIEKDSDLEGIAKEVCPPSRY